MLLWLNGPTNSKILYHHPKKAKSCDPKHKIQVIQAVTFLSPNWRSLNLWKGHLTIRERSQRMARIGFFLLRFSQDKSDNPMNLILSPSFLPFPKASVLSTAKTRDLRWGDHGEKRDVLNPYNAWEVPLFFLDPRVLTATGSGVDHYLPTTLRILFGRSGLGVSSCHLFWGPTFCH